MGFLIYPITEYFVSYLKNLIHDQIIHGWFVFVLYSLFQNSIQYKYLKIIIKTYCQNYLKKKFQHKQRIYNSNRGRHGRDRIVVRFKTTYVISAYHH